jgi:hypothetical protein
MCNSRRVLKASCRRAARRAGAVAGRAGREDRRTAGGTQLAQRSRRGPGGAAGRARRQRRRAHYCRTGAPVHPNAPSARTACGPLHWGGRTQRASTRRGAARRGAGRQKPCAARAAGPGWGRSMTAVPMAPSQHAIRGLGGGQASAAPRASLPKRSPAAIMMLARWRRRRPAEAECPRPRRPAVLLGCRGGSRQARCGAPRRLAGLARTQACLLARSGQAGLGPRAPPPAPPAPPARLIARRARPNPAASEPAPGSFPRKPPTMALTVRAQAVKAAPATPAARKAAVKPAVRPVQKAAVAGLGALAFAATIAAAPVSRCAGASRQAGRQ